jgi:hypothetical protein
MKDGLIDHDDRKGVSPWLEAERAGEAAAATAETPVASPAP